MREATQTTLHETTLHGRYHPLIAIPRFRDFRESQRMKRAYVEYVTPETDIAWTRHKRTRRRTRRGHEARAVGHLECLVVDSEAFDSDSSREPWREYGVDGTTRIVPSRARQEWARHVVEKPIDVRVVELEPLPLETARWSSRRRL